MTIEELKLKIQEKINQEPIINSVFLTGASLFCTNCKDSDYTVIIQNDCDMFKIFDSENKIDYFVCSQRERDLILNFEYKRTPISQFCIDELFKSNTTIYGDDTIYLDLLGNAEKYKVKPKKDLQNSFLSPHIHWENSDKYCNKRLWWAILGLLFIENNSYEVTSEMKNIIQQCHDGVLDKFWESWIKDRIGWI